MSKETLSFGANLDPAAAKLYRVVLDGAEFVGRAIDPTEAICCARAAYGSAHVATQKAICLDDEAAGASEPAEAATAPVGDPDASDAEPSGLAADPAGEARKSEAEVVLELLKANPDAPNLGIIALAKEAGYSVSSSQVSRARAKLKG